MTTRLLIILLGVTLSQAALATSIYRYVDEHGRVTFTDQRVHDGYVPLVKTLKGWQQITPPANWREGMLEYHPMIEEAALRYNISPQLISAVVHAESHFNPVAVSSAGAVGLMQLMPATAIRYNVSNRQDPRQSIEGGTRYLRDLLVLFKNDVTLAVAAYNAGENAVIRRGYKIPPYKETQRYVKKVLALYKHYQQIQSGNYVAQF